jgi:hypothetical protein
MLGQERRETRLDFIQSLWISRNFTCDDDNAGNADDDAYYRKYKKTPLYIMDQKER